MEKESSLHHSSKLEQPELEACFSGKAAHEIQERFNQSIQEVLAQLDADPSQDTPDKVLTGLLERRLQGQDLRQERPKAHTTPRTDTSQFLGDVLSELHADPSQNPSKRELAGLLEQHLQQVVYKSYDNGK